MQGVFYFSPVIDAKDEYYLYNHLYRKLKKDVNRKRFNHIYSGSDLSTLILDDLSNKLT